MPADRAEPHRPGDGISAVPSASSGWVLQGSKLRFACGRLTGMCLLNQYLWETVESRMVWVKLGFGSVISEASADPMGSFRAMITLQSWSEFWRGMRFYAPKSTSLSLHLAPGVPSAVMEMLRRGTLLRWAVSHQHSWPVKSVSSLWGWSNTVCEWRRHRNNDRLYELSSFPSADFCLVREFIYNDFGTLWLIKLPLSMKPLVQLPYL